MEGNEDQRKVPEVLMHIQYKGPGDWEIEIDPKDKIDPQDYTKK